MDDVAGIYFKTIRISTNTIRVLLLIIVSDGFRTLRKCIIKYSSKKSAFNVRRNIIKAVKYYLID